MTNLEVKIMNWYKTSQVTSLPDIWSNEPDLFESGGMKVNIKIIPLDNITEIVQTVNSNREEIEEIFRTGKIKLPLILVEDKGNNIYELHDGQHRHAAYKNVFPHLTHIKTAVFNKKDTGHELV